MEDCVFVLCPHCKSKTRVKLRNDTELKNFLLFCPKCKSEMLIDAKNKKIIYKGKPKTR